MLDSIHRESCRAALAAGLVAALAAGPAAAQIPPCPVPPVTFQDSSALLGGFIHDSVPFFGDGLGGAAWFDFESDGDLDLFLTNGKTQPNALFVNNGNGTFSNVTGTPGFTGLGVGSSGVVAGDIDNDGCQDLFLTGDGGMMGSGDSASRLLYDLSCTFGITGFIDILGITGITPPTTDFSAAFGDIDNDGFLDLFITASGSLCVPTYQPPMTTCVPGVHPNKMFRNTGAFPPVFADVSALAGVDTALGACATFFGHIDNDPWIDLFVTNCNNNVAGVPIPGPTQAFRNLGPTSNPQFIDVALPAPGLVTPGFPMGVAPGDINNDLLVDLFETNLGAAGPGFPNTEYFKTGAFCPSPTLPAYTDIGTIVLPPPNVQPPSILEFGWGATQQDFDLDGYLDVFFAGALPQFGIIGPGTPLSPGMKGNPGTLLINGLPLSVGYTNHTCSMPTNLENRFTSGVAAADYDNDGDVDIVIQTDRFEGDMAPPGLGTPVLLENLGPRVASGWLTVRVEGATATNRDAVGARVAVRANGMTQLREIYAGSSFLSMDSQWQTFAMGGDATTTLLAVWWPGGVLEYFANVAANQMVTLVEGQGTSSTILCP